MAEEDISMIVQNNWFDIQKISESGQCFRLVKIGENKYRTIHLDNYLEIERVSDDTTILNCSLMDYNNIWKSYFDLDNNTTYQKFLETVDSYDGQGAEYIKQSIISAKGIRILKQDKWETLISFIISQRNSIPRIAKSVERLSEHLGVGGKHEKGYFFAFPTYSSILENPYIVSDLGLGYRDVYIIKAAKTVAQCGIESINSFNRAKQLYGIGDKVANCYCLYGLHQLDAFPIDTWVQKILDKEFNGSTEFLVHFKGYEGLLQQCMFYHERKVSNKLVTLKTDY